MFVGPFDLETEFCIKFRDCKGWPEKKKAEKKSIIDKKLLNFAGNAISRVRTD